MEFSFDQIHFFYQPKLELDNHRICGVEALVRLDESLNGMMNFNSLLELIESDKYRLGFIKHSISYNIDLFIREGFFDYNTTLSLNIPCETIFREEEVNDLIDFLSNNVSDKYLNKLYLEIKFEDFGGIGIDDLIPVIRRLRQTGVKVSASNFSIDDAFSKEMIEHSVIDEIKTVKDVILSDIDYHKSFNEISYFLYVSVTNGIDLTLEGIENRDILNKVLKIIDDNGYSSSQFNGQGYFLYIPMSLDSLKYLFSKQDLICSENVD